MPCLCSQTCAHIRQSRLPKALVSETFCRDPLQYTRNLYQTRLSPERNTAHTAGRTRKTALGSPWWRLQLPSHNVRSQRISVKMYKRCSVVFCCFCGFFVAHLSAILKVLIVYLKKFTFTGIDFHIWKFNSQSEHHDGRNWPSPFSRSGVGWSSHTRAWLYYHMTLYYYIYMIQLNHQWSIIILARSRPYRFQQVFC